MWEQGVAKEPVSRMINGFTFFTSHYFLDRTINKLFRYFLQYNL